MPHSIKPEAIEDLARLYDEGSRLFGAVQADAYEAGLYDVFDFLADFPRAARLRIELDPPVRAHPYRSHMIVYDLGPEDCVIILRIRHYRENWLSAPLG